VMRTQFHLGTLNRRDHAQVEIRIIKKCPKDTGCHDAERNYLTEDRLSS
jgi:hypothetical protein